MIWPLVLALACLGMIEQNASNTRSRARQGFPGMWVYSDPTRRSGSGINSQGQVKQVGTIVVNTAADATVYTWTINGVPATYTSGTSATTTTIAAGIAVVINATPDQRSAVVATAATDTVTLTSEWAGVAFTASDSDSRLTTTEASTANAAASAVAFGVALIQTGLNTNGGPSALSYESERLVCVPTTSIFTAQVITATVVNGVATTRAVRVWEIRGGMRAKLLVETVFAGSATEATEATNIAAAVELAAPAATVVAAVAASVTVTFTAEVKGMEIEVEIEQVNAGDITFAATTGPSAATSLHRAFVGISEYAKDTEASSLTSTTGQWPANGGVRYGIRGCMWVANTESTGPALGGDVYVELAPGSTAGQLYAASSATRVALARTRAVWERDGGVSTDGIAAVRLEA